MSWTIDRAAVFTSSTRAPRYERIAGAIEAALERGDLQPGDRLPTVRALARQLEVSSASVAVAYSILERRGRLHAQVGRGTFVPEPASRGDSTTRTPAANDAARHSPQEYTPTWRRRVLQFGDRLRAIRPDALLCNSSWPDPSLLPLDVLQRAYAEVVEVLRAPDLQYGGPEAHPDLARALRPWLEADGVPTDQSYPLVMSSVGQLLTLALRITSVQATTGALKVAVEEPGYHAAFNLVENLGHRLVGMSIDGQGVQPDALREALEAGVQLVVLTPRALNPSGASWTGERREHLADLLRRFPQVVIVEDDHFAGVAATRPGSLTSDPQLQDRTVYARSYSKSIAPDLRSTVVLARGRLFAQLRDARLSDGGWAPRLGQRALALALADPALDSAFQHARSAYAVRRQAATDAVRAALPQAEVATATDGLNIWVRLPAGHDALDVSQHAAHLGVLVSSGEPFYLRPGRRDAVRLSVGRVDAAGAARAGELLGRATLTIDDVPLPLAF